MYYVICHLDKWVVECSTETKYGAMGIPDVVVRRSIIQVGQDTECDVTMSSYMYMYMPTGTHSSARLAC